MKNRLSIGVALLAVSLIGLVGCSAAETSASSVTESECTPVHPDLKTIKPGVLTVAQYEYPPFAYTEGDVLVGVEGEIMQRIADLECLDIEIVSGDAASMITSVQTGRADTTLGSWYRTAQRAEVVRLSEPVITSPLAIVSLDGVSTIDEITELGTVGTNQALPGIEQVQALLGDKLKLYPTNDAMFADFQAGRVDGALLGFGAAITQMDLYRVDGAQAKVIEADERLAPTMNIGQTNFPVGIANEALGEAFDFHIRQLREEGFIEEIAAKYGFPAEVANPGEPNLL